MNTTDTSEELTFEQEQVISKFMEDFAANPSNSNKFRYGLFAYINEEIVASNKFNNLLAVIHRDGGHYTAEHGLQKSYDDAMQLSADRIHSLTNQQKGDSDE